MAARAELDAQFAVGLAHVLNEIAGVQPELDEESGDYEDVEEYAEFDGTELPLMEPVGEMSPTPTNMAGQRAYYIEVPIEGRTLLVIVMERLEVQAAGPA